MPKPTDAEQSWQQKIEEILSYIANNLEQLNEQVGELGRRFEDIAGTGPMNPVDFDELDDRPLR